MELPDEHNGQRNDKRAERAHAGKPDDQPAVRGLTGGLAGGFLGGLLRCLLRDLLLGLPLELGLPGRFRPASGPCKAQGALFTLDSATGLCTAVERVDIR